MTRKEWLNTPNNDPIKIKGFKNYKIMVLIFKFIVKEMKLKRPNIRIVYHHYDFNSPYENWKVIPMYSDEHTALHNKLGKIQKHSEEWKIKMREKMGNKKWWTNGISLKFQEKQPEGYISGGNKGQNKFSNQNYIWITNGKENKRIHKNENIPDNFYLGRKYKFNYDNSKKIICIETKEIFNSAKEAGLKMNITCVNKAARLGICMKGYHFKYI